MDPKDYLPAPEHWKQFSTLPEKVKLAWIRALRNELRLLILEKKCFKIMTPDKNEPVIPVTAKCRTKIRADGTVDKLKVRVCLRGDLQAALTRPQLHNSMFTSRCTQSRSRIGPKRLSTGT